MSLIVRKKKITLYISLFFLKFAKYVIAEATVMDICLCNGNNEILSGGFTPSRHLYCSYDRILFSLPNNKRYLIFLCNAPLFHNNYGLFQVFLARFSLASTLLRMQEARIIFYRLTPSRIKDEFTWEPFRSQHRLAVCDLLTYDSSTYTTHPDDLTSVTFFRYVK